MHTWLYLFSRPNHTILGVIWMESYLVYLVHRRKWQSVLCKLNTIQILFSVLQALFCSKSCIWSSSLGKYSILCSVHWCMFSLMWLTSLLQLYYNNYTYNCDVSHTRRHLHRVYMYILSNTFSNPFSWFEIYCSLTAYSGWLEARELQIGLLSISQIGCVAIWAEQCKPGGGLLQAVTDGIMISH